MFILLFFYLSITMAQPCRVMFLTTSRFKGDLGGIEGADRICHFAAANGAKSVKEFIDDGKTYCRKIGLFSFACFFLNFFFF